MKALVLGFALVSSSVLSTVASTASADDRMCLEALQSMRSLAETYQGYANFCAGMSRDDSRYPNAALSSRDIERTFERGKALCWQVCDLNTAPVCGTNISGACP